MPYCANCGEELPSGAVFCPSCGTPVTMAAPPPAAVPTPTMVSVNYADLSQRIIAAIVDSIIVGVVVGILAGLFALTTLGMMGLFKAGIMSAAPWMWAPWMWLVGLLIPICYYTYFEGTSGQTIGKKIMNIKVVKADGAHCDYGSAFVRNLLRFIDSQVIGLVGIIVISVTEKKQRVGDIVAKTIVVKT